MDGNKDEAIKCLRIGKDALDAGDRPRALKFLSKARRLDPSLPIDSLISSAGDPDNTPADDPKAPDTAASSSPSPSSSARPRTARVSPSDGSARSSFTEEQITIVRQIKKEKDYYKILGLERTCTVEDVRKSYRKISLKVHPDKNHAPGADEAFKAVSRAFQCLSDEESRKRYDLVGSDEPEAPVANGYRRGYNGFYEAEIDPDEIFRQFFGGMGPSATTPFGTFQFRTGGMGMGGAGRNGNNNASGNSNIRALIQLLPIIIFVIFSLIPSPDPVYSLQRAYGYEHKVETAKGVPYYVKSPKFEQEYPYQSSERIHLEQRIEREYISLLSQNCRLEMQRRSWGISSETPHCDLLRKF